MSFRSFMSLTPKSKKAKQPVLPDWHSTCIQVPLHWCLFRCFHTDSQNRAVDGCHMWYVNSWALGWSRDMYWRLMTHFRQFLQIIKLLFWLHGLFALFWLYWLLWNNLYSEYNQKYNPYNQNNANNQHTFFSRDYSDYTVSKKITCIIRIYKKV